MVIHGINTVAQQNSIFILAYLQFVFTQAQHQHFTRMHPGVSGRKHLPRFHDRPVKPQTRTHKSNMEPPRMQPNQHTQPYNNYGQHNTNQDYFSRYGNRASQQRLDDDPYPQTAGFAGQYGGQNSYPRRQGYQSQPTYDSRYAVRKRNGEEGVGAEEVTAKGYKRKKRDTETSAGAGTVQRSISTGKK